MSLQLDPMLLLFFALGMIILYVSGWLLLAPFRLILRLMVNSLIGAAALVVFNLIGGAFSVTVALNPLNSVIVGVFGVPGLLLLLVIKLIL